MPGILPVSFEPIRLNEIRGVRIGRKHTRELREPASTGRSRCDDSIDAYGNVQEERDSTFVRDIVEPLLQRSRIQLSATSATKTVLPCR